MNLIKAAVERGGAEIITLALRRANTENKENILDFIPDVYKRQIYYISIFSIVIMKKL